MPHVFLALFLAAATANAVELRVGNLYPLTFTDVDQHQLSTSDGHVTIISVVTRKDEHKAQSVGDSVPHSYYGDPKFRLITLVNFQQGIFAPLRGMISAMIRHRLDGEAKELQKVYAEKKLMRNARNDIFVVADFDGKAVSQLGIAPASSEFTVFIFDGRGRLIRRWNDVPPAGALAAALVEAR
ncbi:MAG: hypothetical protein QOF24_89 [Verrucomicrobiota bacterium]|jgi:hypothetical protein